MRPGSSLGPPRGTAIGIKCPGIGAGRMKHDITQMFNCTYMSLLMVNMYTSMFFSVFIKGERKTVVTFCYPQSPPKPFQNGSKYHNLCML